METNQSASFPSTVDDKRRHQRVASELPIQYKNLRKPGDAPFASSTRNLSEGGVSFKTGEFISLACRMVVEIILPTVSKPIKAITKVAWIRKIPTSQQYELGNQFLDMAKEDKKHISAFVNRVMGETVPTPAAAQDAGQQQ